MQTLRITLTCLLVMLAGRSALAQGEMTFEPEDVSEPAPAPTPRAGQPPAPGGVPRAVVLVVRSGEAEPELAQKLTEALARQVLATGKLEVMPSEDLQARLFAPGERAAQDCVTNAVCLSGYGKELWLDKIVMGVLYKGEAGYNLNVDLVGVENGDVEQYANRDLPNLRTASRDQLDREMAGLVFKLFGLRDPSLEQDGPRKRLVAKAGPVQTGLAWTAAGLSGAALVTGLVLGAQARSVASELDGDSRMTQRQYSDKIDDGEGKAMGAYLAFAATGVLLATSATLFLIKPLQEETEAPRPSTPGFGELRGVQPFFAPGAASAELGVTAGLRF